ncbi:hypothetical protein [Arthrobacter sp. C9C5]|uniref:DUF7847 domain-containing protein n=1 Tax=Arthrobacter sp. C9C5 TaxID=2735267 RepID=UPI0015846322|nr:hypothetical protein [Arthrobacter sp. C9C5]NUU31052.1 hypothetical protein [Arthrobacter sp. C9C5]
MSEQEPSEPQQWGGQPQWGTTPPAQQPAWGTTPQWGQQPQWGAPHPGPRFSDPYVTSPYGQPRYVAPPKPGIVPLRPLMFGEILDGAFRTVRRNPAAMLGAGVIAQALTSVTSALAQTGALFGGSGAPWPGNMGSSQATAFAFGTAAGVGALLFLLTVLISVVMQGAMAVPVARALLNRRTSFRQMWTLSRSRTGALLGLAGLLILGVAAVVALAVVATMALIAAMDRAAVLAVVLLFFGLMIVLLWLGIRFLVAPAAIVVEEIGTFAGLRRSWQLTGRNWWRILGVTLVVGLLVGVITQIVLIPVSLLGNAVGFTVFSQGGEGESQVVRILVAVVGTAVTALVAAVGYAFQTSTVALVYLDLRMRKDGLDLSLLRQLETGSDPEGVPGRTAAIRGDTSTWQQPPYGPPPVRR